MCGCCLTLLIFFFLLLLKCSATLYGNVTAYRNGNSYVGLKIHVPSGQMHSNSLFKLGNSICTFSDNRIKNSCWEEDRMF